MKDIKVGLHLVCYNPIRNISWRHYTIVTHVVKKLAFKLEVHGSIPNGTFNLFSLFCYNLSTMIGPKFTEIQSYFLNPILCHYY